MAEAGKKKRAVPKGRHKSQIKREKQDLKRHERNVQEKSFLKTMVKKVREAVGQKDADLAKTQLKEASRIIQKAGSKGIIHKKNASRKVSRLSTLVQSLSTK